MMMIVGIMMIELNKGEMYMNNILKLLKEAVKILEELEIKILEPEIGETREIAGMKWIILDKLPQGYLALAAESVENKQFGSNNDWKESAIRTYLNEEMAEQIEAAIGTTLPEFRRDLFSLDGQTEYGACMDKISVITVDEYRKYRKHIPNGDICVWTCTPWSTRCNDDEIWVAVICPSGSISNYRHIINYGFCPLCIFPFEIFEPKERKGNTFAF